MKKLKEKEIIHLMKSNKRYLTILPYEEFRRMKMYADKFMKISSASIDEKVEFEIRFKQALLTEILDIFNGDIEKISGFIKEIEKKLKNNPFPEESLKIVSCIYELLIFDVILRYRVNKQKKLITIISVRKPDKI